MERETVRNQIEYIQSQIGTELLLMELVDLLPLDIVVKLLNAIVEQYGLDTYED